MPTGLLEIRGTIELAQYWPDGESDGDTTKVQAGQDSFTFTAHPGTPHPGAAAEVTHAFDGAVASGAGRKQVIDAKDRITLRYQGIDATELHYRPEPPKGSSAAAKQKFKAKNGNFRQPFGESAAVALAELLHGIGADPVPCVVRTRVDKPADAIDMYGRFIGDIYVEIGGQEENLNLWLVRNGWAFPTFYNSMLPEEIQAVLDAAAAAKKDPKAKARLPRNYLKQVTKFDPAIVFENHGSFDAPRDVGPVMMPKMFRRSSTWNVAKAAGLYKKNFKSWLELEPDHCYELKDFLQSGPTAATPRKLDEFVTAAGVFDLLPQALVFREQASSLLDSQGHPVVAW